MAACRCLVSRLILDSLRSSFSHVDDFGYRLAYALRALKPIELQDPMVA